MNIDIKKSILEKILDWTKLKISIESLGDIEVYYREREVWWVNLGQNIGFEQNGKNSNYERSVLVFKKFNKNMFWAIPMTSQEKVGNYFYKTEYQGKFYYLILPQVKLMSSKRLLRRVRKITSEELNEIKKELQKFL